MGIWDNAKDLTEAKQKSLHEFSSFYFTAKRLHTIDRWLDFPFNWNPTVLNTKVES
jgi:hypothetical protein